MGEQVVRWEGYSEVTVVELSRLMNDFENPRDYEWLIDYCKARIRRLCLQKKLAGKSCSGCRHCWKAIP